LPCMPTGVAPFACAGLAPRGEVPDAGLGRLGADANPPKLRPTGAAGDAPGPAAADPKLAAGVPMTLPAGFCTGLCLVVSKMNSHSLYRVRSL
jgi:hypothetical protein